MGEAQFLRKLFQRASQFVNQQLKAFDPAEIRLFSKTLHRFAESKADTDASRAARQEFLYSLQKELLNVQKFPSCKPLMHLQQVQQLSLTAFGSTVMKTGLQNGDLDISVNGMYRARHAKANLPLALIKKKELQAALLYDILKFLSFRNRLRSKELSIVLSKARIPILKFTDRQHGFQCDVSIGNVTGVLRSRVLSQIIQMDKRVRLLILLVKQWALVHGIKDPSTGSFGSYPLTIMTLAFCNERGMLPSLSNFIPSTDLTQLTEIDDWCRRISRRIDRAKTELQNQESLLELVVSCFVFLALYTTRESLYDGLSPRIAVCCHQPGLAKDMPGSAGRHGGVFIRDPFSLESNCGKPVTSAMLHKTSQTLQNFMADISGLLICPREERKQRWQCIFRSLFNSRLIFAQDRNHKAQRRLKSFADESPLLDICDDLIVHYLDSHRQGMHKTQRAAFASWFLDKYDKTPKPVQEKEEDLLSHDQPIFRIKDASVAA